MGGQQVPINLSGLCVAAILILIAIFDRSPLESNRPPRANVRPEPPGPFETIPARIWEDPFEAIAKSAKVGNELLIRRYLDYLATSGPTTRLMVLPILVRTAPHPADREWRLRIRLALHAALARKGAYPLQPERLGLWRWKPSADPKGILVDVPFEAFRLDWWRDTVNDSNDRRNYRRDKEVRVLLVLWVNDEAIQQDLGRKGGNSPECEEDGNRYSAPLAMIDDLLRQMGYPPAPDTYPPPGDALSPKPFACTESHPDSRPSTTPRPQGSQYRADSFSSCVVRVVGPSSSDSLEGIYRELLGWRGGDCANAYTHVDNDPFGWGEYRSDDPWSDDPTNFRLVSPFATAPLSEVDDAFPKKFACRLNSNPIRIPAIRRNAHPCATVIVQRTVPTDDRAISALVDELILRGVDPTQENGGHGSILPYWFSALNPLTSDNTGKAPESRDHVVLVSEWDTAYGRALPKLFRDEVARRWCQYRRRLSCRNNGSGCLDDYGCTLGKDKYGATTNEAVWSQKSPPAWVHSFSYMRGLDGASSADTVEAFTDAAVLQDGKIDLLALAAGEDAGFKEPAIGTNQYDYLRRLTQQVVELDKALKRQNRGAIRAFGVLGTDYYDKLLILQALKERFPSHLYFTTDLDAGLLDAKVFAQTRNLIVATPFALHLQHGLDTPAVKSLQGGFPPFRHALQTSLFLTILSVLDGQETALATQAKAARPLLFEVGRNRFFQLAPKDLREASRGARLDDNPFSNLEQLQPHAPGFALWDYLRTHSLPLCIMIVTGAAAGLLIMSGGTRVRGFFMDVPRTAVILLYLILASVMLGIMSFAAEPIAFVGGVSVWPSELLRLMAGLLACLLLIHGWRQLKEGDETITARFQLEPGPDLWLVTAHAQDSPSLTLDPKPLRPIAIDACKFFGQPDLCTPRPGGCSDEGFEARANERDLPGTSRSEAPPSRPTSAYQPGSLIVAEWIHYRKQATLLARTLRVLPATLVFVLFSAAVIYGFGAPLSPHRGPDAYWLGFWNGWLFAGLPFFLLLFAAVDEALLCSRLIRRFEGRAFIWPVDKYQEKGGCTLARSGNLAAARDHWLATELIALRTAPAAQVAHLPFVVILFLLVSLSSRFDNWSTPTAVILLIGLSLALTVLAGALLRRTARRIREQLIDDLKGEVAGIEYRSARTPADKLHAVVKRIESIHEGAFTEWYNDPVFRALAWVVAIAILIVTDYSILAR